MSTKNKERLDSIQAQALRIASGAARGTASAALQVDMGEPPLQIRRLQLQLQYAVKVKSFKNHPARKVFEPHWTVRYKKFDRNSELIYYKVIDFIEKTDIIESDHVHPVTDPLWCARINAVLILQSLRLEQRMKILIYCALWLKVK